MTICEAESSRRTFIASEGVAEGEGEVLASATFTGKMDLMQR